MNGEKNGFDVFGSNWQQALFMSDYIEFMWLFQKLNFNGLTVM